MFHFSVAFLFPLKISITALWQSLFIYTISFTVYEFFSESLHPRNQTNHNGIIALMCLFLMFQYNFYYLIIIFPMDFLVFGDIHTLFLLLTPSRSPATSSKFTMTEVGREGSEGWVENFLTKWMFNNAV